MTGVRTIIKLILGARMTSSSRRRTVDANLTLEHFLMPGKIFSLYRSFIRSTKGLGDLSTRREVVDWVRRDFEKFRHVQDLEEMKLLLARNQRQLKQQLSSASMLVGEQGEKFRGPRKLTL